jgi:threonine/homoserine/homoserine lactone efflux protein
VFEEIGVFYRGLVLGLMIAAPVGPIGLLCIRRTLQRGFVIGLATGLGAACADTLFGAVAALGVTAILDFMRHYDVFIRMVGGLALGFGAWHAWRDRPQPAAEPADIVGKVIHIQKDYVLLNVLKGLVSGFAITIANPVTLFAVLAVVASFSHIESHLDAITIITGVAFGSALWWLILAGGVALVRGLFNESRILFVNRVTAVALASIAVWAIGSGIGLFLKHSELLTQVK